VYTPAFIFPGQEIVRWFLFCILISQIAMCGQKGPLEMPKPSALDTVNAATGFRPQLPLS